MTNHRKQIIRTGITFVTEHAHQAFRIILTQYFCQSRKPNSSVDIVAQQELPGVKFTSQQKFKTATAYFTGRLGFNKVLIFKDEKASEGSDNPVWNVLLQETDYNPEQKTENATLSREQEIQRGIDAQAPVDFQRDLSDEIPFSWLLICLLDGMASMVLGVPGIV